MEAKIFIGCAGWSIPRIEKPNFPESGAHLERYASSFSAVEINSSFYRSHRVATYARWANSVPSDFRFAVKVPKEITHTNRLEKSGELLAKFLDEVAGLGETLGCLLVQIPPSLAFEQRVASEFFGALSQATQTPIVFEPRHVSWFDRSVGKFLKAHHISQVAADPPLAAKIIETRGWPNVRYYRLHGSPRVYYSIYSEGFIRNLAHQIKSEISESNSIWCIFDNTALGAAIPNARQFQKELARP